MWNISVNFNFKLFGELIGWMEKRLILTHATYTAVRNIQDTVTVLRTYVLFFETVKVVKSTDFEKVIFWIFLVDFLMILMKIVANKILENIISIGQIEKRPMP